MLSELAELIVEAFVRNGIPREKAVPESEEVAFQLHRRWAGLTFVFPVKDDLALQASGVAHPAALRWIERRQAGPGVRNFRRADLRNRQEAPQAAKGSDDAF
ncbi:hypothetical protein P4054_29420 [Pseudomonas aeruginosa]|nr:hypothetical protein [Pseudomonas aeruginosa]